MRAVVPILAGGSGADAAGIVPGEPAAARAAAVVVIAVGDRGQVVGRQAGERARRDVAGGVIAADRVHARHRRGRIGRRAQQRPVRCALRGTSPAEGSGMPYRHPDGAADAIMPSAPDARTPPHGPGHAGGEGVAAEVPDPRALRVPRGRPLRSPLPLNPPGRAGRSRPLARPAYTTAPAVAGAAQLAVVPRGGSCRRFPRDSTRCRGRPLPDSSMRARGPARRRNRRRRPARTRRRAYTNAPDGGPRAVEGVARMRHASAVKSGTGPRRTQAPDLSRQGLGAGDEVGAQSPGGTPRFSGARGAPGRGGSRRRGLPSLALSGSRAAGRRARSGPTSGSR